MASLAIVAICVRLAADAKSANMKAAHTDFFDVHFLLGAGKRMEIDRLDARILSLVQMDNKLTSDRLGELVGLSATAVQRRLKRLRSRGIIEGDVSIVAPKAIGFPVSIIVSVVLEPERGAGPRLKKAIRAAPEVTNGYSVAGETDYILLITTRSMDDYDAFTKHFFYDNPDIRTFQTHIVMDRVKVGFALPIDALDFDSG